MSSLDVSKEKSSIQSEYVQRGKRKTGASFRADRPSRAKSRPDTEKDSEDTSMFVRKKRALRAAFASARHGAETSASFDQKHAINFPTKSRRFVPR